MMFLVWTGVENSLSPIYIHTNEKLTRMTDKTTKQEETECVCSSVETSCSSNFKLQSEVNSSDSQREDSDSQPASVSAVTETRPTIPIGQLKQHTAWQRLLVQINCSFIRKQRQAGGDGRRDMDLD